MKTYLKITIFALLSLGLYLASYHYGYISHTVAWLLVGFVIFVIFLIPTYFSPEQVRARTVTNISKEFRNYCDRIVQYQYNPTSKFSRKDLRSALGIKLPKPTTNNTTEVYTFIPREGFRVVITIISCYMNVGGGSSYQEYAFTGYSFGSCDLFEEETECAHFNYPTRYIHWKTEEFEEANNCVDEFEHLYNRRKAADEAYEVKMKKMLAEIKTEQKLRQNYQ